MFHIPKISIRFKYKKYQWGSSIKSINTTHVSKAPILFQYQKYQYFSCISTFQVYQYLKISILEKYQYLKSIYTLPVSIFFKYQ